MNRRRVVALAVALAVGAVCLPGTSAQAAGPNSTSAGSGGPGAHTKGRNWG